MALLTGILTGGSNNHQTTSEEANGVYTDFISQGIVGVIANTGGVAPATGGFAVNAQGSPNMTVAVGTGVAYVTGTPTSQNSQTFRVKNTASSNVTISANSSGSTKYDWVYLKLDATKLNTPNSAGDDVATLVTSRSSSASSDDGTPPTYGYALAVVTVANGASSITNGNISDSRSTTGASAIIADGSVTTAKIAAGAVTNAKLSTTSGDVGGPWKTWSPTLSNITNVNGTVTAKYTQVGKTVHIFFRFVLGSSSAMGSAPAFSLPVTASSDWPADLRLGLVQIEDSGVQTYFGWGQLTSTTTLRMVVSNASNTYLQNTGISSTIPMSWGTADHISFTGTYEAA